MRDDAKNLLSNPTNAQRLRESIAQLNAGEGNELSDEYLAWLQGEIDARLPPEIKFRSVGKAGW